MAHGADYRRAGAVPWQVQPGAGARPPPLHAGHLPCGALPLVLVLVLIGPRRGAGPVMPRGGRMIAGRWHRTQGARSWAAVHPR